MNTIKYLVLIISLIPLGLLSESPTHSLPEGIQVLPNNPYSQFELSLEGANEEDISFKTVPVDGPTFDTALSVSTVNRAGSIRSMKLEALSISNAKRGDVMMLHLWARATATSQENNKASFEVIVRRTGVTFNSSIDSLLSVGSEWEEFYLPFTLIQDATAHNGALRLYFGFTPQTVEIGGLEWINYKDTQTIKDLPATRFTYDGREEDAVWRKEALERIEQIRKSDLTIKVVDANGNPVANAAVSVNQTQSAFHWGTSMGMMRLLDDSSDSVIYREKILELFNSASTGNDLKWGAWIGEWGRYPQDTTKAGLQWLKDHNFYTRGHVLVWPGLKNLPQPVTDLIGTDREAEIPKIVTEHIRHITQSTEGLLDEWDVINEPYNNDLLMKIFGDEIMIEWFEVARASMPSVGLYVNDYDNQDETTQLDKVIKTDELMGWFKENNTPVDGLGLQAHFLGQPNAPEEILKVLDRYWKHGYPIRFTEFDIYTDDEQLQADFTRDFFIAAYSHPASVGIQLWGFWAGAHWRPNAAMFRRDWSEKPNLKVYKSLVLDQWRTHETGTSDSKGQFSTRGFHGDYTITVQSNGKVTEQSFSLKGVEEDGKTITLTVH